MSWIIIFSIFILTPLQNKIFKNRSMIMEALKMLSLTDLQVQLGISQSTLFRLRRRNEPPLDKAIKLGKRILIPESALNEWVSRNTQHNEDLNEYSI